MPVRIILADDHQILREGLRGLLDKQGGMEIVAEAASGQAAIQLCREHRPDVVIMDITMPDMNGIEATRAILEEMPDTKIIGLSMHSDKRFVSNMLAAGASGYLRKNCASDELAHAIDAVVHGQIYISPKIGTVTARDFVAAGKPDDAPDAATLSHRERQILQCIAEGKSTKEIAGLLNLGQKTIEKHRQNIMEKLRLRSVAELTKFALREGLISLDE